MYKESHTYQNENGDEVEINEVIYERTDGSGIDYVEQTKINGVEVGHHTEHPDGTIHNYGIYSNDDNNEK